MLVRAGQQEAVDAGRTLRAGDAEVDAMVSGLVATLAEARRAVSYTVTGLARPIDATLALALYRVMQEALTNAAKHAPGQPVEVRLSYTDTAVAVCVLNDMPELVTGRRDAGQAASRPHDSAGAEASPIKHGISAVSGGQGLRGMSERMAAVGGTFAAGLTDSQWRVDAQVSA